jgi:endoglucanase
MRGRCARPGSSVCSLRSRPWLPWRHLTAWAVLALTVIASVLLVLTVTVSVVGWRDTSDAPHPADGRRSGNPFSGADLFVDPYTPAALAEARLERSDPVAAAQLRKITAYPAGFWLGGWMPAAQVAAAVRKQMREAAASHSMPLLVLYAFPYHGCGNDAAGRPAEAAGYQRWIDQVAAGIGAGKAAVILEPDALAQLAQPDCLSPEELANRLKVLRRAVDRLVSLPHTAVYLDAGHSRWRPAKVMAPLLLAAGAGRVRGFSLNVSNFNSTAAEESYGDSLSAMLHGAHYVIDTSRNGAATATAWCNPPGQALGVPPTTNTGNPLIDALLWIKPPWASDGTCNNGPPAGMLWLRYALSLAANARW